MQINNNSLNPSISNTTKKVENQSSLPDTGMARIDCPEDLVTISSSQKTSDGKIPIIITSSDKDELYKAKNTILECTDGKIKDDLPIIGGLTAELSEDELKHIVEHDIEGIKIYLDDTHKLIDPDYGIAGEEPSEPASPEAESQRIYDQTAKPERLPPTKTLGIDKLWEKGFTGKGITIAVVDSGIHPHKDFGKRIKGFKDFVNGRTEPYDDNGHGTHVAGDAAGDGTMSKGKYKGAAPDAELVGIKVLDRDGRGKFSDIIKGVQWAVQNKHKYNIKVLNLSLGGPVDTSYKEDPLCQAIVRAMDAGIVTLTAAGNSGPDASTIQSPANDPRSITVGNLDDKGTVSTLDDKVADKSSRGPTSIDGDIKPDILAPGIGLVAPSAYGSVADKEAPHVGKDYVIMSGTSMATPVLAGVAAIILQAYPNMSHEKLKDIFTRTSRYMSGVSIDAQGRGVVQPDEAFDRAKWDKDIKYLFANEG